MNKDVARLVENLEAWAPLVAAGYEVPAASKAIHEAASTIRALDAKLREAVEVLQLFECECANRCEVIDYLPPNSTTCRYGKARAFLATMEKTDGK